MTETTNKVVEALRSQPMTLALLVLVAIFMYLIYSGVTSQRESTHEVLKAVIEQNAKAQELLSRCVVQNRTQAKPSDDGDDESL